MHGLGLEAGLVHPSLQFHWDNAGYTDFEAFLSELKQSKRKSIRQVRQVALF
jgi:predicted N-acyltransferase